MVKREKNSSRNKFKNDEKEMLAQEGTTSSQAEEEEALETPLEEAAEDLEEADEVDIEGEITIESLQEEVERLRKESEEYLDGWQRARAEFANYKKRADREHEEARKRIASEIFARYLGVLDDLELALKEKIPDSENAAWIEGIELVYQKFRAILEAEGVEVIEADGERFDPNFHEAISYEESDELKDGQIIEVVKQGYLLGDRVVRPALVRVAK